jgi:radical SAM superfamily enzyme YgiQ (UPF0313 family)
MGMGRVDGIDREVADALAASGFEILLLGVETLHPESAEALNKGFDAARLREVVTLLHRRGILAFASMVIGFPWEDRRDILDTYRRCKRLPLLFFTYHYATPFPGTNLWDDAARDHLLEETDASRFTLSDAVMRTRHLTRRSLRHLRRRIVAGHLASPRYWGRTLRMGLRDPACFAMLAGAVLHAVAQLFEDLVSFL